MASPNANAASASASAAQRKSKGRQKIEMKKMSNESNLQVTFSKRRSGLFKKASELCTLCGAEVAIIVFSPGEKVFSFGHPNVDTVLDRYLTRAPQHSTGTLQFIEAHRSANVRDLNAQLTQVNNQLDVERKRCDELTRIRRTTTAHFWWASAVEGMTQQNLEQLRGALEELKKSVTRHADRLIIQGAVATANPIHQFMGASSSNAVVAPPAAAPAQLFAPPPQMVHPAPAPGMYDGGSMMRHQHGGGFNLNSNNNNNMGGFGFF